MAHFQVAHEVPPVMGDERVKNSTSGQTESENKARTSHDPQRSHPETKRKEERQSFLDLRIAGFPWPFFATMMLIMVAVLGIVLKVIGLF
jgi:hypothetical protein